VVIVEGTPDENYETFGLGEDEIPLAYVVFSSAIYEGSAGILADGPGSTTSWLPELL
jgi:hypothetical protein